MEGQRLAIIPSSPPVILPGCDQPLLCFWLNCCQGSDLPASPPACVQFSESWKQSVPRRNFCKSCRVWASVECVPRRSCCKSCGVSGLSMQTHTTAGLTRDKMPWAFWAWSFAGRSKLLNWEVQFLLLFVTYSKWVQFVPGILGFMNVHCHNCSPCSGIRHNTRTELICLCWMLLFHCVYFLSVHLSAFGYSAAQRRDWKIPFCFLGCQPDHVIWQEICLYWDII